MIFITKLQTNRCFCEHESASIGFKKPRNPRPSATSEIHHSFRRCPSYFECGKLPPPPKKFKLILIYIYLQKELDVFSKVNKQLKKKKGSGRQSFINWWVGVQKKGSSSKILMKVFSLSRYTLATHSTLFTWEVRLSYSFQGGQQAIHCIQFPFALFHYSQLNESESTDASYSSFHISQYLPVLQGPDAFWLWWVVGRKHLQLLQERPYV